VNRETRLTGIEERREGVLLRVAVRPESSEDRIEIENGELVVYVSEPPIHGRANAALKRVLSRKLGVRTGEIEIVRGLRDRVKYVFIRGLSESEVRAKLEEPR